MKKTKIAVIGLGGIAQLVHLPILSKLNNAEISAVSDKSKSNLKSVADKFGIKNRYVDYKELLRNDDCDAVIISTPTSTHRDIAIDVLKAGKHVLIEKPVAKSLKEAEDIKKASLKYNKSVMVGMNLRYRPDAMLVKSLLNNKEIGDVFYIKASWLRKQSSSEKWFMKKGEAGGGVLMDLGILLLDLSIWLLNYADVSAVSVKNFMHRTKAIEDSSVGLVRLKGNKLINFEVSWSLLSDKDNLHLDIFGTQGTVHLNPLRAYKLINGVKIDYSPSHSAAGNKNLYKKSYENELKHFIGTVEGNVGITSSIDSALHRMKLLEALYKSANTNAEVKL